MNYKQVNQELRELYNDKSWHAEYEEIRRQEEQQKRKEQQDVNRSTSQTRN